MKVDIGSWLGIVVLLCLGFTLGKITAFPDLKAAPQQLEVGKYQLVVGEVRVPYWYIDWSDSSAVKDSVSYTQDKTVFRINTITGEVDRYDGEQYVWRGDSSTVIPMWSSMTETKVTKY